MRTMKLSVYKYDPATDAAPYYVSGQVEYREQMTLLEALQEFHENIEPVNFDYSCGCRLCGRCAVMANGQPVLMCVTKAEDRDYKIEPLKGYPVIRDLIVEKSSFDDKLSGYFKRIRVEPFTEETIVPKNYDPSVREPLYTIEFCCRCGVCDAACPVVATKPNEYVGPAGMLAIAYRFYDPLDQGDRVMEAVSEGLYHCIMCGMCDTVCQQQDIKHV
ncbi:MAG: 4Fe-4S dicluster domain-containing protein, partial [Coriobacteriaceae bacterium]|nr:4Fe-4S dicluster domain-containing protein [Coriobacteriaceae bacterium]